MRSKFIFPVLAFLIFHAWVVYSQTQISGSVSGRWEFANSPYIVIGNIKVEQNDTLIIEPGVQVLFDGHFSFIVRGHLATNGTQADSIIFTHNHPDSLWMGIGIYKEGNKSILEYCRIEYSDRAVSM